MNQIELWSIERLRTTFNNSENRVANSSAEPPARKISQMLKLGFRKLGFGKNAIRYLPKQKEIK